MLVFKELPIFTPLIKGFVGFAFMYVVIIIGALDPKWTLTKRLWSIRTPYSVIGFTIHFVHPLSYVAEVINQIKEFIGLR